MKSVSVVANLNIGVLPGSVNIIELGPVNETHWRLCHHFARATVHCINTTTFTMLTQKWWYLMP